MIKIAVLELMIDQGGKFERRLSQLYLAADAENSKKLETAFSDIFERYQRLNESENIFINNPDFINVCPKCGGCGVIRDGVKFTDDTPQPECDCCPVCGGFGDARGAYYEEFNTATEN